MQTSIHLESKDWREGYDGRIALPLLIVTVMSFGWMSYHVHGLNLKASQPKSQHSTNLSTLPQTQAKPLTTLSNISQPSANNNPSGSSTANPQPAANGLGSSLPPGQAKKLSPAKDSQLPAAAPSQSPVQPLLNTVEAPVKKLSL